MWNQTGSTEKPRPPAERKNSRIGPASPPCRAGSGRTRKPAQPSQCRPRRLGRMSLSSPVPPSCPLRRIPTGMEPAAVVGTVPAAEALSGFPFLQAVSAVRHHTMSRSRSARYGFGFVIGHPLFLGGGVRTIPNPMPKRPGRDLTSPEHGDTVFSRVRPAYGMVLLYKRHFRGTSLLPKRNTMSVSPARSKLLCS